MPFGTCKVFWKIIVSKYVHVNTNYNSSFHHTQQLFLLFSEQKQSNKLQDNIHFYNAGFFT